MHVMIDIETMGRGDLAPLLSVGAVAFNGEGVYPAMCFSRNLALKHNLQIGRVVTAESVEWWLTQSDSARHALLDYDVNETLESLCIDLAIYIKDVMTRKHDKIWVNGAMFDFRILRNCYRQVHQELPWHYGQECCMRALRAISKSFPEIKSWYETKKKHFEHPNSIAIAHCAIDDAIAQACFVQQFISGQRK